MFTRSYCFVIPLLIALVLLGSSCRSMGPKTIQSDAINYNERIALQENEQMLLNMVRLRYREVPHFLNVASVINSYTRTGSAGISGNAGNAGSIGGSGNIGGSWSDKPTITYVPMSGQTFSKNLLTPISPSILFFLIQSGWSPERLFRLTTSSVNGLRNENCKPRVRKQAEDEYIYLLNVISEIQDRGAMGVHFIGDWPKVDVDVYFPSSGLDDSTQFYISEFTSLLNLDPSLNRYSIKYGIIQRDSSQVVLETHSVLEMISNLSWYIDVPPEHIAEKRTLNTFESENTELIRISYSGTKPENDFISVKSRDQWFYIDDRDVTSKTTFAIIRILLSLADEGGSTVGPLISIGN